MATAGGPSTESFGTSVGVHRTRIYPGPLGSGGSPSETVNDSNVLSPDRLSEQELDQLAAFLEGLDDPNALTLEGVDGLFCALIAGPTLVRPSQYLPAIWGGALSDANAFASLEDASAVLPLLMRHWNSIISDLDTGTIHLPLVFEAEEGRVLGRAWARGCMRGVALAPAGWKALFQDDLEEMLLAIPLVAGEIDPEWPKKPLTAETSGELLMSMGAGCARAYRYFAAARRATANAAYEDTTYRRMEPKVGRNAPCPCGSGRKFKHCCGAGESRD
jgi:uncharacterized protein